MPARKTTATPPKKKPGRPLNKKVEAKVASRFSELIERLGKDDPQAPDSAVALIDGQGAVAGPVQPQEAAIEIPLSMFPSELKVLSDGTPIYFFTEGVKRGNRVIVRRVGDLA